MPDVKCLSDVELNAIIALYEMCMPEKRLVMDNARDCYDMARGNLAELRNEKARRTKP
jgi:hypothetical protein